MVDVIIGENPESVSVGEDPEDEEAREDREDNPMESGLKNDTSNLEDDCRSEDRQDNLLESGSELKIKKTDAMTWKDKKETWNKVAQEFQALAGGDRTSFVLRNNHEGIKQALKAKLVRNKVEIFKTVGGSAQIEDLTNYENELIEHIQLNVNGLPAMFDSDRIPTENLSTAAEASENKGIDPIIENTINHSQENEIILAELVCENEDADMNVELHEIVHAQTVQTNRGCSTKDTLNSKLNEIIVIRAELLQLQMNSLNEENAVKKKELAEKNDYRVKDRHLKLQHLELQIEKQKLKIHLLQEQCIKE
ncbi:Myb/SANT-like DNA-binding domain [Popillia japonica]|uniref:Regulatory protein zeste n=1 Tax=Popillia japonica TaxID=7064 RepID=A0AAW1IBK2_POPJA